jgi:hypothetical protein
MKEIELSRGMVCIVDDDDYEVVSARRWHAAPCRGKFYARRGGPGGKHILMHRELMGFPVGMDIDHANGDTLDNRRSNLRIATRSQNSANSMKRIGATGFKGVTKFFRPLKKQYVAQIRCGGSTKNLGYFETAEEAGRVYDRHAYEYWGEFASLNFPDEIPHRDGDAAHLIGRLVEGN